MGLIFRIFSITWHLAGFLLWYRAVQAGLIKHPEPPPLRFRRMIERLGTTFIKLGQLLSIRQDVLPESWVLALQGLQDDVAPVPTEVALGVIERELGAPVERLFAEFEREPLAAASIAQVHRARLPDGTAVIVKVRRPGIVRLVKQDMTILRGLITVTLPFTASFVRYEPLRILDDLQTALNREMDLVLEARNTARFAAFFADSHLVRVPCIVPELVTHAVLVETYCAGVRVQRYCNPEAQPTLAAAFVDAYLRQWFVLGFFHGDPHPGNVLVSPDDKLCLIDFGLVGYLDHHTRRDLAAFIQAFTSGDADWVLDSMIAMGGVSRDLDREAFRIALEELLADYATLPLAQLSYAEAFLRIVRLGHGHDMRMPQHLMMLNRALFLMESVLRHLDPNLNLRETLTDQAKDLLMQSETGFAPASTRARLSHETGFLVDDLPEAVSRLLYSLRTVGPRLSVEVRDLREIETHVNRAMNRLAIAIVTLGMFVASSLLMRANLGPHVQGFPIMAGVGYWFALWLSLMLASGIMRSGKL